MNYTSKFKKSPQIVTKQAKSPAKQPSSNNLAEYKPASPQNNVYRDEPSYSQSKINYFKHENFNVEAYEKHLKSNGKMPSQQSSVQPDPFVKTGSLLENIMSKHEEMKRKIQRMKNEKENQEKHQIEQLSFRPKINHNPRYHISSNMDERNQSWNEARQTHYTSIRQELVQQDCKECTFSPKMIAKERSTSILNKKRLQQQKMKDKEKEASDVNPKFEKIKTVEQFHGASPAKNSDYRAIKEMIKSEMRRISFDF